MQLFGNYRAQVLEIEDPDKKDRIKVYIPYIMENYKDLETQELCYLWALPAANPGGGRNEKSRFSGSFFPPSPFSWVWIFFEGGNITRPYYTTSFHAQDCPQIPERELKEPHKTYVLIRTFEHGRTIVTCDDKDLERTEITGKKRLYVKKMTEIKDADTDLTRKDFTEDVSDSVYMIDKDEQDEGGNMSTILIDDREGNQKILIKTYKGDYLNFDIEERKISMKTKNDIDILSSEGNVNIGGKNINMVAKAKDSDGGNLKVTVDAKIDVIASDDVGIFSNKKVNVKSDTDNINIYSQSGSTNISTNKFNLKGTKINLGPGTVKAKVTAAEKAVEIGEGESGTPLIADELKFEKAQEPKPEGKRDK